MASMERGLGLGPIILALLIAGCAPAPRRASPSVAAPVAPAPNVPDVGRVPDATPRVEPRSASGNPPFYEVAGHRYMVLSSADGYVERGVASWYGTQFHGLRTATGEPYDMFAMTAAHKTLPLPCYARITNLSNGRSVVVRINDRGPFVANRIIDLSYTAASRLDMIRNGTAFVQVETLSPTAPQFSAALPVTTAAASSASAGLSSVPAMTGPLPAAPVARAPAAMAASALPTPAAATGATGAASTASPTAGEALPAARFYIQVGAYGLADNARRTEQKLRGAGVEQVFTIGATPDQPLLRVRIGPISSVQEFDRIIARLNALGYSGARLAQD
jgi:rare lipoprotein A